MKTGHCGIPDVYFIAYLQFYFQFHIGNWHVSFLAVGLPKILVNWEELPHRWRAVTLALLCVQYWCFDYLALGRNVLCFWGSQDVSAMLYHFTFCLGIFPKWIECVLVSINSLFFSHFGHRLLCSCLGHLSCPWITVPDAHSVRKKRFILGHVSVHSQLAWSSKAGQCGRRARWKRAGHCMVGRKQSRKGGSREGHKATPTLTPPPTSKPAVNPTI